MNSNILKTGTIDMITSTSNISTSTDTSLSELILNNWVNYIDFGARGYALFIHVVYFLIVIFKRDSELQSRSCLFLHNVNLATLLIALVYTSYIPYSKPSLADPLLNRILCRLTEIFWMWIKYARVLSLLLLAFYRYTACCKTRWYIFINSRLINIFVLIFFCWVVSILTPAIFKYSLGTTFSIYFCVDGFAQDHLEKSIEYYVANTILSSFVPTLCIFFIYWKIYDKLKEQNNKLTVTQHHHHANSNKLRNFAKQFIIMNCLTSISTGLSTFIDFVNAIAVCFFFFKINLLNI